MKVTFIREANYICEAKALLSRYFNNESLQEVHERMKLKAEYDDQMEKTFQILEKMHTKIMSNVTVADELAFYFQPFDTEDMMSVCLADNILYEAMIENDYALEDLPKYVKEQFHKNSSKFIKNILNIEETKTIEFSDVQFMKELDKMDVADAIKWNIWRVYNEFDEHVDILFSQILKMIPHMVKVYEDNYKHFNYFYDFWQKAVNDETFFEKIDNIMHFSVQERQEIIARPLFIACNTMRLNARKEDYSNCQIQIGVLFTDEKIFGRLKFTKEEICARMKLLGDTSKYELMKLIKDEAMYGAQLAESLQLSTATVSHHISTLTSRGFVMLENDANRVYYRLNKVQLEAVIEQLKNDLL